MDRDVFFDRLDNYYLDQSSVSPIIIAYSGGADSTALLLLGLDYAKARGRNVHAVLVDHALRAGSQEEAALSAKRARDLGANSAILTWKHGEVSAQIQARARKARYGLLGDYCRAQGSAILLTGHNRDDHAETVWMRQRNKGSWRSRAGISEISYSPIWPELRQVAICRPLLSESRSDIRAFCKERGANYVDDPSNENIVFDRIKARRILTENTELRDRCLNEGDKNRRKRQAEDDYSRRWLGHGRVNYNQAGALTFDVSYRLDLQAPTLADMIMCAGGRARRPDMASVERLLLHIKPRAFKARTLGGAMIERVGEDIVISREPSAVLGRQDAPASIICLKPKVELIWDRRFLVFTSAQGICAGPLWPLRGQLDDKARRVLKTYLPTVRQTLPGLFRGDKLIAAPSVGFNTEADTTFEASPYLSWRLQPLPVGDQSHTFCG